MKSAGVAAGAGAASKEGTTAGDGAAAAAQEEEGRMPVLANMLVSSGVRLRSEPPPPFSLGVAAATGAVAGAGAAVALVRAQAKQRSHSAAGALVEEGDACSDREGRWRFDSMVVSRSPERKQRHAEGHKRVGQEEGGREGETPSFRSCPELFESSTHMYIRTAIAHGVT